MFDEKAFIEQLALSRKEYEKLRKELMLVRMKIALEGFECDVDKFEIAPELVLRRASLEERQVFWSRAYNLKDAELKAIDNEFFAEFDFKISRGGIHSLEPGNGINLVSIFFALTSSSMLSINRGNFYLVYEDEFRSAGFFTTPNEYRFTMKVRFTNEELNSLKALWPHFKDQYEHNFSFALVARRYFYSQLRLSLEDRIIDLMIALEALLVPDRSVTKSDKIATRLALLIYPDYDRTEVENLSLEAYRIRNKIIHGGQAHFEETFEIDLMSKYVRVAIQKYLTQYAGLSSKELI